MFPEIPTKTRISLRVEQKVVVQYACDGKQFVVSVRDAFGTLERSTVLRYLVQVPARSEQQIDRKIGGAGLGLYLMVNSATTVYFNVLPGVATEATCVFDLETPKMQLEQFGFFTEKIDAGGRLAAGPSRRLPADRSSRRAQATGRRHQPHRAGWSQCWHRDRRRARARRRRCVSSVRQRQSDPQVTFTTVPKGATIEIEGRNEGTAVDGTLVRDLEVGHAYPVVAKLDGYEPKSSVVQPQKGGSHVTFELQARTAIVFLDTQPSGANVEVDGKPVGTTPLTISTLRLHHRCST